jgi:hypothetical protein
MDADEVEEEVVQLFLSIVSDHEGVIHISEPSETCLSASSSKSFIRKLAIRDDRVNPWPLHWSVHRTVQ